LGEQAIVRTEDLIVDLARQGAAVSPVRSPAARFAAWAAVAASAVAAGVLIKGVRADLTEVAGQNAFVAMGVITLVTAVLAAIAALLSSVPGAPRAGAARVAAIVALTAWVVWIAASLVAAGPPLAQLFQEPPSVGCVMKVVLVGTVPVALLLVLARRAAPLEPHRTAGLAVLAGLASGALAAQGLCPIDAPAHLLAWHLGPVVSLAALALLWPSAMGLRRG
jgi:hypothetical protein